MASPAATILLQKARNFVLPFQNFVDAYARTILPAGVPGTLPSAAAVTASSSTPGSGTCSLTFKGITVTTTNLTTPTATQVAAGLVAAVNADPTLSQIIVASNSAGVLSLNAIKADSTLNGLTFTVASAITGVTFGSVTAFGVNGTVQPQPGSVVNMDGREAFEAEPGMSGTAPSGAAVTVTAAPTGAGTATFIILGRIIVATIASGTAAAAATACANAINADPVLGQLVFATTSGGATITLNAINASPALNGVTYPTPTTTAASMTFGSVTAFGTGGAGPVLPLETFAIGAAGNYMTLRANHPVLLGGQLLAAVQKAITNDNRRVI